MTKRDQDSVEKTVRDIRGREYNGRYFNNLQGWKIETEPNNTSVAGRPPLSDSPPVEAYDDDVPF